MMSPITPDAEREIWDAKAAGDALQEVWAEPVNRWRECLYHLTKPFTLPTSPRVLDLGCGIGRLCIPLAKDHPGWRIYGLDISPAMLALARSNALNLPNLTFVRGDGRTLPPSIPSLHAAFSIVTFQHIPPSAFHDYIVAVSNRLLPDGIFRFQFVEGTNHSHLAYDAHLADIRAWCESSGMDVIGHDVGLMYPNWRWVTAKKVRAA